MRTLVLLLAMLSTLAHSQINIVAPTLYDDGTPLALGDIARYDVCVSNVTDDVCTSVIDIPGNATHIEGIPADTKFIKVRTVDIHGVAGDYNGRYYHAFRKPLAPGLTYSIPIAEGQ